MKKIMIQRVKSDNASGTCPSLHKDEEDGTMESDALGREGEGKSNGKPTKGWEDHAMTFILSAPKDQFFPPVKADHDIFLIRDLSDVIWAPDHRSVVWKLGNPSYYKAIDKNSQDEREFMSDVEASCLDRHFIDKFWSIECVQRTRNRTLASQYDKRKTELENVSSTEDERQEIFVFSMETQKSRTEIANDGYRVGLQEHHTIGYAGSGVHLIRHYDILTRYMAYQLLTGRQKIVVSKACLGKTKAVDPSKGGDGEYNSPDTRYDCLHSAKDTHPSMPILEALSCSTVYFYEFDPVSSNNVKHPRQIMPYAVITLQKKPRIRLVEPFLAVDTQHSIGDCEVYDKSHVGFQFRYNNSQNVSDESRNTTIERLKEDIYTLDKRLLKWQKKQRVEKDPVCNESTLPHPRTQSYSNKHIIESTSTDTTDSSYNDLHPNVNKPTTDHSMTNNVVEITASSGNAKSDDTKIIFNGQLYCVSPRPLDRTASIKTCNCKLKRNTYGTPATTAAAPYRTQAISSPYHLRDPSKSVTYTYPHRNYKHKITTRRQKHRQRVKQYLPMEYKPIVLIHRVQEHVSNSTILTHVSDDVSEHRIEEDNTVELHHDTEDIAINTNIYLTYSDETHDATCTNSQEQKEEDSLEIKCNSPNEPSLDQYIELSNHRKQKELHKTCDEQVVRNQSTKIIGSKETPSLCLSGASMSQLNLNSVDNANSSEGREGINNRLDDTPVLCQHLSNTEAETTVGKKLTEMQNKENNKVKCPTLLQMLITTSKKTDSPQKDTESNHNSSNNNIYAMSSTTDIATTLSTPVYCGDIDATIPSKICGEIEVENNNKCTVTDTSEENAKSEVRSIHTVSNEVCDGRVTASKNGSHINHVVKTTSSNIYLNNTSIPKDEFRYKADDVRVMAESYQRESEGQLPVKSLSNMKTINSFLRRRGTQHNQVIYFSKVKHNTNENYPKPVDSDPKHIPKDTRSIRINAAERAGEPLNLTKNSLIPSNSATSFHHTQTLSVHNTACKSHGINIPITTVIRPGNYTSQSSAFSLMSRSDNASTPSVSPHICPSTKLPYLAQTLTRPMNGLMQYRFPSPLQSTAMHPQSAIPVNVEKTNTFAKGIMIKSHKQSERAPVALTNMESHTIVATRSSGLTSVYKDSGSSHGLDNEDSELCSKLNSQNMSATETHHPDIDNSKTNVDSGTAGRQQYLFKSATNKHTLHDKASDSEAECQRQNRDYVPLEAHAVPENISFSNLPATVTGLYLSYEKESFISPDECTFSQNSTNVTSNSSQNISFSQNSVRRTMTETYKQHLAKSSNVPNIPVTSTKSEGSISQNCNNHYLLNINDSLNSQPSVANSIACPLSLTTETKTSLPPKACALSESSPCLSETNESISEFGAKPKHYITEDHSLSCNPVNYADIEKQCEKNSTSSDTLMLPPTLNAMHTLCKDTKLIDERHLIDERTHLTKSTFSDGSSGISRTCDNSSWCRGKTAQISSEEHLSSCYPDTEEVNINEHSVKTSASSDDNKHPSTMDDMPILYNEIILIDECPSPDISSCVCKTEPSDSAINSTKTLSLSFSHDDNRNIEIQSKNISDVQPFTSILDAMPILQKESYENSPLKEENGFSDVFADTQTNDRVEEVTLPIYTESNRNFEEHCKTTDVHIHQATLDSIQLACKETCPLRISTDDTVVGFCEKPVHDSTAGPNLSCHNDANGNIEDYSENASKFASALEKDMRIVCKDMTSEDCSPMKHCTFSDRLPWISKTEYNVPGSNEKSAMDSTAEHSSLCCNDTNENIDEYYNTISGDIYTSQSTLDDRPCYRENTISNEDVSLLQYCPEPPDVHDGDSQETVIGGLSSCTAGYNVDSSNSPADINADIGLDIITTVKLNKRRCTQPNKQRIMQLPFSVEQSTSKSKDIKISTQKKNLSKRTCSKPNKQHVKQLPTATNKQKSKSISKAIKISKRSLVLKKLNRYIYRKPLKSVVQRSKEKVAAVNEESRSDNLEIINYIDHPDRTQDFTALKEFSSIVNIIANCGSDNITIDDILSSTNIDDLSQTSKQTYAQNRKQLTNIEESESDHHDVGSSIYSPRPYASPDSEACDHQLTRVYDEINKDIGIVLLNDTDDKLPKWEATTCTLTNTCIERDINLTEIKDCHSEKYARNEYRSCPGVNITHEASNVGNDEESCSPMKIKYSVKCLTSPDPQSNHLHLNDNVNLPVNTNEIRNILRVSRVNAFPVSATHNEGMITDTEGKQIETPIAVDNKREDDGINYVKGKQIETHIAVDNKRQDDRINSSKGKQIETPIAADNTRQDDRIDYVKGKQNITQNAVDNKRQDDLINYVKAKQIETHIAVDNKCQDDRINAVKCKHIETHIAVDNKRQDDRINSVKGNQNETPIAVDNKREDDLINSVKAKQIETHIAVDNKGQYYRIHSVKGKHIESPIAVDNKRQDDRIDYVKGKHIETPIAVDNKRQDDHMKSVKCKHIETPIAMADKRPDDRINSVKCKQNETHLAADNKRQDDRINSVKGKQNEAPIDLDNKRQDDRINSVKGKPIETHIDGDNTRQDDRINSFKGKQFETPITVENKRQDDRMNSVKGKHNETHIAVDNKRQDDRINSVKVKQIEPPIAGDNKRQDDRIHSVKSKQKETHIAVDNKRQDDGINSVTGKQNETPIAVDKKRQYDRINSVKGEQIKIPIVVDNKRLDDRIHSVKCKHNATPIAVDNKRQDDRINYVNGEQIEAHIDVDIERQDDCINSVKGKQIETHIAVDNKRQDYRMNSVKGKQNETPIAVDNKRQDNRINSVKCKQNETHIAVDNKRQDDRINSVKGKQIETHIAVDNTRQDDSIHSIKSKQNETHMAVDNKRQDDRINSVKSKQNETPIAVDNKRQDDRINSGKGKQIKIPIVVDNDRQGDRINSVKGKQNETPIAVDNKRQDDRINSVKGKPNETPIAVDNKRQDDRINSVKGKQIETHIAVDNKRHYDRMNSVKGKRNETHIAVDNKRQDDRINSVKCKQNETHIAVDNNRQDDRINSVKGKQIETHIAVDNTRQDDSINSVKSKQNETHMAVDNKRQDDRINSVKGKQNETPIAVDNKRQDDRINSAKGKQNKIPIVVDNDRQGDRINSVKGKQNETPIAVDNKRQDGRINSVKGKPNETPIAVDNKRQDDRINSVKGKQNERHIAVDNKRQCDRINSVNVKQNETHIAVDNKRQDDRINSVKGKQIETHIFVDNKRQNDRINSVKGKHIETHIAVDNKRQDDGISSVTIEDAVEDQEITRSTGQKQYVNHIVNKQWSTNEQAIGSSITGFLTNGYMTECETTSGRYASNMLSAMDVNRFNPVQLSEYNSGLVRDSFDRKMRCELKLQSLSLKGTEHTDIVDSELATTSYITGDSGNAPTLALNSKSIDARQNTESTTDSEMCNSLPGLYKGTPEIYHKSGTETLITSCMLPADALPINICISNNNKLSRSDITMLCDCSINSMKYIQQDRVSAVESESLQHHNGCNEQEIANLSEHNSFSADIEYGRKGIAATKTPTTDACASSDINDVPIIKDHSNRTIDNRKIVISEHPHNEIDAYHHVSLGLDAQSIDNKMRTGVVNMNNNNTAENNVSRTDNQNIGECHTPSEHLVDRTHNIIQRILRVKDSTPDLKQLRGKTITVNHCTQTISKSESDNRVSRHSSGEMISLNYNDVKTSKGIRSFDEIVKISRKRFGRWKQEKAKSKHRNMLGQTKCSTIKHSKCKSPSKYDDERTFNNINQSVSSNGNFKSREGYSKTPPRYIENERNKLCDRSKISLKNRTTLLSSDRYIKRMDIFNHRKRERFCDSIHSCDRKQSTDTDTISNGTENNNYRGYNRMDDSISVVSRTDQRLRALESNNRSDNRRLNKRKYERASDNQEQTPNDYRTSNPVAYSIKRFSSKKTRTANEIQAEWIPFKFKDEMTDKVKKSRSHYITVDSEFDAHNYQADGGYPFSRIRKKQYSCKNLVLHTPSVSGIHTHGTGYFQWRKKYWRHIPASATLQTAYDSTDKHKTYITDTDDILGKEIESLLGKRLLERYKTHKQTRHMADEGLIRQQQNPRDSFRIQNLLSRIGKIARTPHPGKRQRIARRKFKQRLLAILKSDHHLSGEDAGILNYFTVKNNGQNVTALISDIETKPDVKDDSSTDNHRHHYSQTSKQLKIELQNEMDGDRRVQKLASVVCHPSTDIPTQRYVNYESDYESDTGSNCRTYHRPVSNIQRVGTDAWFQLPETPSAINKSAHADNIKHNSGYYGSSKPVQNEPQSAVQEAIYVRRSHSPDNNEEICEHDSKSHIISRRRSRSPEHNKRKHKKGVASQRSEKSGSCGQNDAQSHSNSKMGYSCQNKRKARNEMSLEISQNSRSINHEDNVTAPKRKYPGRLDTRNTRKHAIYYGDRHTILNGGYERRDWLYRNRSGDKSPRRFSDGDKAIRNKHGHNQSDKYATQNHETDDIKFRTKKINCKDSTRENSRMSRVYDSGREHIKRENSSERTRLMGNRFSENGEASIYSHKHNHSIGTDATDTRKGTIPSDNNASFLDRYESMSTDKFPTRNNEIAKTREYISNSSKVYHSTPEVQNRARNDDTKTYSLDTIATDTGKVTIPRDTNASFLDWYESRCIDKCRTRNNEIAKNREYSSEVCQSTKEEQSTARTDDTKKHVNHNDNTTLVRDCNKSSTCLLNTDTSHREIKKEDHRTSIRELYSTKSETEHAIQVLCTR